MSVNATLLFVALVITVRHLMVDKSDYHRHHDVSESISVRITLTLFEKGIELCSSTTVLTKKIRG